MLHVTTEFAFITKLLISNKLTWVYLPSAKNINNLVEESSSSIRYTNFIETIQLHLTL